MAKNNIKKEFGLIDNLSEQEKERLETYPKKTKNKLALDELVKESKIKDAKKVLQKH